MIKVDSKRSFSIIKSFEKLTNSLQSKRNNVKFLHENIHHLSSSFEINNKLNLI